MHAFTPEGWDNFFVTISSAAAALAGLLFVALSINLSRILTTPSLATRAGEVIVVLTGVLATGLFGLVPDQPRWVFGSELLGTGLIVWAVALRTQIRALARHQVHSRRSLLTQVTGGQFATIPLIVAGTSVLCERGYGLYWLVPAMLFSFVHALLNAWVLLVEILR